MSEKILKQLHKKLLKKEKTVATAESCTGGLLASLLTNLSGSSNYFLLGVITYSNKSKEIILHIPAKTIIKYGAVSRQVAKLMAQNIRKKTHANFGLSITGIAGPAISGILSRRSSNGAASSKATTGKPVGTIFIALADKNKTLCRKFLLSGEREAIRKQSVQAALRLLSAHI